MEKRKAVVAGHICIDITPVFPPGHGERVEDIFLPGKMIHMNGAAVHTGGAVANTGLAMKILGNDVRLMGKIGKDAFGKMVLDILREFHAEKEMIISEEAASSYTVVLAMPGIDRIMLHDPGANNSFCADDLDWKSLENADLFHFGYPSLMRRMYEQEGREVERIFSRVKENGTVTSLDLAAVDEVSGAGRADWDRILKRVLPYVDFFVPSAEELCQMLDKERYKKWLEKAAGRDVTEILSMEDIYSLGEKALAYGAGVVLIKCASRGIYYRTADTKRLSGVFDRLSLKPEEWADKEGFELSFQPEAVRSGTGAGDTSIAAFLSSVLRGEAIEEAVQMAAAAGACCVATYDTLSGLMPFEKLKEKVRQGWKKNDVSLPEK